MEQPRETSAGIKCEVRHPDDRPLAPIRYLKVAEHLSASWPAESAHLDAIDHDAELPRVAGAQRLRRTPDIGDDADLRGVGSGRSLRERRRDRELIRTESRS